MFKKKSLKFTYDKVSRDLRHAETLRARESSRFERLSMIRSINDSEFVEKDMEACKEEKIKEPEKKKPSRLEMLFKWKQEKQIKKEMEKQAKKKPFYVGGKKEVAENQTLLSFRSNSSFNSSKSFRSKLITPTISTLQSSRILNSKQGIPSATTQFTRPPNARQITPSTAIQSSSRILNSKQTNVPKSASNLCRSNSIATLSKKFPASVVDKTTVPKSASNLCRSNSTATLSKKFPASVVDKTGSSLKYGNSLTRINSTATMPKKYPVASSTMSKVASSKAAINKVSLVNKTPIISSKNGESQDSKSVTIKSKTDAKPINKVCIVQKSVSKNIEEKSIKKIGTVLPKVTSNGIVNSRGITVQSKMPVPDIHKKFGSNPKLNQKETPQKKENESLRKGYCFRTAISNSMRQKTGTLLKTPIQGTPKKQEKISRNVIKTKLENEASEQSVDNISDVTFNSDISIIKPARTSFAPINFTFQPPEGLNNFIFEDEDYDIYQDLEEVKMRFMSRTSTPSKDSERKSSIQSSKESLGSNNNVPVVETTSNISSSKDINISELMSSESFHIKDSKFANEKIAKQVCDEVICNSVAKNRIKDVKSDIVVIEGTCQKPASISSLKSEADVIAKEESCQKIAFISPVKIETDDDDNKDESCHKMESFSAVKVETNVVKEEIYKKLSISPVNTEVELHQRHAEESSSGVNKEIKKLEILKHTVDNELQMDLFCEKQSLHDFSLTQNPKNMVEINSNEEHFKQPIDIETQTNSIVDKLLEDDDSLLDSIDLNKIQLMDSDNEDSGEDDIASPQILKCSERISNGTVPKRVSMLRKLSIMNSIAEICETDEFVFVSSAKSAKKNKDSNITPRRSKRLSNHRPLNELKDSPVKKNTENQNATPPRRSSRLMKHSEISRNFPVSPFQENSACNVNSCQSVRLIDLSSPEKAACEKLLGENFENLDPNTFLIDFESPTTSALTKSKKISLLYSPEKRKSIRKSIRGDLMSFSPA